jgi:hypothetical protein
MDDVGFEDTTDPAEMLVDNISSLAFLQAVYRCLNRCMCG